MFVQLSKLSKSFVKIKNSTKTQCLGSVVPLSIFLDLLNISRQKRISYGHLTVRGGGLAPSTLTVGKCGNFDPFFPLKFDSLILKTYFKQM